ncbi:MAG: enoyl-CoA hydratase/isomerase family protein [Candidatus Lokiarchaeota archaeon]|nr:enoyl-CoA hydratase/isomerase family protein [Candidatus Lokiarchaeota archaeon]
MSNQDLILYELRGRIAIITINRPEKAHSFNGDMLKSLHAKLVSADNDEKVRCILIKSTGQKFFSAGYDLKEIQGDPQNVAIIQQWGRKVNETMLLMKKPIIAQIQGIAIGFGAMLILASDLKVFADRSKEDLYLRLPELAISAFPQTGATLLPLMGFGFNYAKNVLYTTDKIGVKELRNINFPTRVFPLDKLEAETIAFAKEISKYQPKFSIFLKSMLTIMEKGRIKSYFDLEDECGKVAYDNNIKNLKDIDDFIKEIHQKFT